MEGFEHFCSIALRAEGFVVMGNVKIELPDHPGQQNHGYEVDLVGVRSGKLVLASVKSFFDSPGVKLQGVMNNGRHQLFNNQFVHQHVIQNAATRFGFREDQKGGKARILPMAPEFAELLRTVPEAKQSGKVFDFPITSKAVGLTIGRIGKAAGVKTKDLGDGKAKYATAHDLRRAFGLRWSSRIMPNRLQELMRHEHIGTTMQFYVGQDADATAEAIWATVANHLANAEPEAAKSVDAGTSQVVV